MNASEPFDIEKLFNKIRQLEIHTPQGVSGRLTKESRYVFNYSHVNDDAAVSLVMPVREESYASGDLMSVFKLRRSFKRPFCPDSNSYPIACLPDSGARPACDRRSRRTTTHLGA